MKVTLKTFLLSAMTLLSVSLFSTTAQAQAAHPAATFIEEVGGKALNLGALPSSEQKLKGFCQLVKQSIWADYVIDPRYNVGILGDYYSQATNSQLERIKDLIDDLLVFRLTEAFQSSSGGSFKVQPRVFGKSDPVIVNAELYTKNGHLNYNFRFTVLRTNKGLQIVDAQIKGITVSRYLKSEYTSFMKRSGGSTPIPALINHLTGQYPACP